MKPITERRDRMLLTGGHQAADTSNPQAFDFLEKALLACFLVGITIWRIVLIHRLCYNPDEFFLLGGCFRLHSGLLPYLDFVDPHPPLSYLLCSPVIGLIGERSDCVDLFRWLNYPVAVAFSIVLFFLVRRLFGTRLALWSLCILHSFSFFLVCTIQVRRDLPAMLMLLVALIALVARNPSPPRLKNLVASAIVLGLAISIYLPMAFPAAGICLWLLMENGVKRQWKYGIARATIIAALCAAVYILVMWMTFGVHTLDAVRAYRDDLILMRLYEKFEHGSSIIIRRMLSENLVPFLLVGLAVFFLNVRWARDNLQNPALRLLVVLTDTGIIYLALRNKIFEQAFLFPILFGSILAAVVIREGTRILRLRSGNAQAVSIGPLLSLFFVILVVGNSRSLIYPVEDEANIDHDPSAFLTSSGIDEQATVDPVMVRNWMAGEKDTANPFPHLLKSRQLALFEFLLNHSTPADTVVSDWLNPPYRHLPIPMHDGDAISRLYRTSEIRVSSSLSRIIRKYDPTFTLKDDTETEHMIRLFEIKRPRVILLMGNYGQLFVASDAFFDWLVQHYTIVLDRQSSSFFALRRNEL